MDNALQIEADQAIYLAEIFSRVGSSYTMEVFDRVIGSNIDDIPVHRVYEAFMAFSTASKAEIRPKITSLLLRTLTENLD